MEKRNWGLSQEALKLIACITMFIDHFGYAIVMELPFSFVPDLYYACRILGRIAFPIYCFLLAEGMRRTRSPKKYILRLAIGILLAELPFDILFEGGFSWAGQSVMVTLTLGALMLLCMQKAEKKWMKTLLVLPFAFIADICKSDYGGWGVGMIAVFALIDGVGLQTICVLLLSFMKTSARIPHIGIPLRTFAVLAMIPISCYSGVKRTQSKAIQWMFYVFYPAHLVLLRIILGFMG